MIGSSLLQIPLRSQNISFLRSPSQFHSELWGLLRKSKARIGASFLYLGGHEQKDTDVTHVLHEALTEHPELKVHMHLDYLRGTQKTIQTSSQLKGKGQSTPVSSLSLLMPLSQQFPDRFCSSFFHVPSRLDRPISWLNYVWGERLSRARELLGVSHMKFVVADNTVLLTGANLAKDYLTDRQDRYMVVADSPIMADFFWELLQVFSPYAHQSSATAPQGLAPPILPLTSLPTALDSLWHQTAVAAKAQPTTDTFLAPFLHFQKGRISTTRTMWTAWNELFHTDNSPPSVSYLSTAYYNPSSAELEALSRSGLTRTQWTVIAPAREANGFSGAKSVLAAVPQFYQLLLAKSVGAVAQKQRLLSFPLPQFSQSFSPDSSTSKSFCQRLFSFFSFSFSSSSSPPLRHSPFRIFEYVRDFWTYHAKGVWCFPLSSPPSPYSSPPSPSSPHPPDPHPTHSTLATQPSTSGAAADSAASGTIIGSSNFGVRSDVRDLELQCILHTTCPSLTAALKNEVRALLGCCREVDPTQLYEEYEDTSWLGHAFLAVVSKWL